MDAPLFDINALRKPLFAASGKYLAGVASRLSAEGVTVKTESLEANRPAYAIAEDAQKNGMELIAWGPMVIPG